MKQIWMSRDTQRGSRYGLRTLGGIFGLPVLGLALIIGVTVLGFSLGWPMKWVSVLLCAGVTALITVLALRLGQRGVADATLFFLTEEDRLFVLDARCLTDCGGSAVSQAVGMLNTQTILRRLAHTSTPPAGADEVRNVERIKEHRTCYTLVCRVRPPGRAMVRRTYFIGKDMEHLESLLRQLERRERGVSLELGENRTPFAILVSILVCCGFSVLCVLSHPAVAKLPKAIYFPCLGIAFLALCCAVWFGIRQHRGP